MQYADMSVNKGTTTMLEENRWINSTHVVPPQSNKLQWDPLIPVHRLKKA